jgi:hypothetical protein
MKHYEINFDNHVCKICGRKGENRRSLGNHLTRSHGKMQLREYVLRYYLNDQVPKCACGCGQEVNWHKTLYKFNEYVNGHNNEAVRFSTENQPKITQQQIEFRNQRIREAYQSPELRQRVGTAVKEAFASDKTHSQNLSNSLRNYWSGNEEAKSKRREECITMINEGKFGPHAPFKTEWKHNPFTGQDEYMHSSWESAFLDKCVAEGKRVTKKHNVRIRYTDENGIERTYIPDFVAPNDRVIYEIKGYETITDRLKAEACEQWCSENGWSYSLLDSASMI